MIGRMPTSTGSCPWRVESLIFFFFSSRRRHTRLQGDWSSDVCSSDLLQPLIQQRPEIWRQLQLQRNGPCLGMGSPQLDRILFGADQRVFIASQALEALKIIVIRQRRSEEHTSELQSPCNLVCRHLPDNSDGAPASEVRLTREVDVSDIGLARRLPRGASVAPEARSLSRLASLSHQPYSRAHQRHALPS